MIPRIAGRPVHLTARDGTKTGAIVLTIQWSRQADPWETVTTDHNVAFDSWETVANWFEDRARTMDAPVEDVDMPAPIREMVSQWEGGQPSPGVPAWSARDLAASIRTELVDKPHLDGRLLATRGAFETRIQQRAAAAAEAERARVRQQSAVAQIAQAKPAAAARMAGEAAAETATD